MTDDRIRDLAEDVGQQHDDDREYGGEFAVSLEVTVVEAIELLAAAHGRSHPGVVRVGCAVCDAINALGRP